MNQIIIKIPDQLISRLEQHNSPVQGIVITEERLNICSVDLEILEQAVAMNFEDFEDAVQYSCALPIM